MAFGARRIHPFEVIGLRGKTVRFWKCLGLCLLPFAAFFALVLLKEIYARFLMPFVPPCLFRMTTGLLCPSCGMTHSIFALCRLDFSEALRQNAIVPAALVLGLVFYVELWIKALGHSKTLVPRKMPFWFSLLGCVLVYGIGRNFVV